jgi:transcriptional regulator with XRE-family HTH domain
MPTHEPWHNIGRKVLHLRKAHQLTIKQLANRCDLSPNAISLLERGEVVPTVATLCKIAAGLGAPVSSFFQEVCPNEVILTRGDRLARQPLDKAVHTLTRATMPSDSALASETTADRPSSVVYTRELVLCLSGQIEYEAEGQCYQLRPGDTLSFNGHVPHCWRSRSTGPAVAVMVLCNESNTNFAGE